jgi:hypothetical protein
MTYGGVRRFGPRTSRSPVMLSEAKHPWFFALARCRRNDRRRCTRIRIDSQQSRGLVTDRAQGQIVSPQSGYTIVTQTILSARF